MEKSSKSTVEQIPATSTKQTTLVGGRVQQLRSTVEQNSRIQWLQGLLDELDRQTLPQLQRSLVSLCFGGRKVWLPKALWEAARTGQY